MRSSLFLCLTALVPVPNEPVETSFFLKKRPGPQGQVRFLSPSLPPKFRCGPLFPIASPPPFRRRSFSEIPSGRRINVFFQAPFPSFVFFYLIACCFVHTSFPGLLRVETKSPKRLLHGTFFFSPPPFFIQTELVSMVLLELLFLVNRAFSPKLFLPPRWRPFAGGIFSFSPYLALMALPQFW